MGKSDFNKLSSIVDDFLLENDLHVNFFPKALAWAKRGLRELKLDVAQDVKTVLLPVSDRKTVTLPDDFVDWVKVAARNGQYFMTLGINGQLNMLPRTTSSPHIPGLLSQHMPNSISFGQYSGFFFNNFDGDSFFSIDGGLPSKGYFRIADHGSCKEMLMDYDYSVKDVYIEYITDGMDACAGSIISPYFYDYLIKYMEFKYEEKNNPKASERSIDRKGADVEWATRKIRARQNKLDPQTLLNITRQEARLTPHL